MIGSLSGQPTGRHSAVTMKVITHTHTHRHAQTHTRAILIHTQSPYYSSPVTGTLALLLKCALFLNEGVSPFLLRLLYIGVSGRPLAANDKGVPKSEVKPGGELGLVSSSRLVQWSCLCVQLCVSVCVT